jgi:hypothetical protein
MDVSCIGGCCGVKLTHRLAGIDANLDDLQAGIEACSRAAQILQTDTTKLDALRKVPLLRDIVRHVKDLQVCARDQREAMQQLRDGVSRLQDELKRSNGAVRPPPLVAGTNRAD